MCAGEREREKAEARERLKNYFPLCNACKGIRKRKWGKELHRQQQRRKIRVINYYVDAPLRWMAFSSLASTVKNEPLPAINYFSAPPTLHFLLN